MHLEKIEMTGFKSFADKTVIEFDKGVTAVVGPNGSGKSNLAEAVRWVLGEQSAKNLRGKKMNDVVFAGSQSRKPVNIAEVSLIFNNEDGSLPLDFAQVSITRRINRKGESECFINKKPCRLKDITDLLMDSGIGKDSFSMISQGRVEQIFQNKPEERRSIFEDAAGIAKYKNRKWSAERKLAETQDHLDRVEDILHEINGQLASLEKQRNTALSYQDKKQKLSEIEIALAAVEIETLHEQWQLSKKELLQYEEQIEKLEEEQKRELQALEELKQHASETNEETETLQADYISLIQKLEQLEGQKKIIEQRTAFFAKDKLEQQRIIQEKCSFLKREKEALAETIVQKKEKNAEIKAVQAKLREFQAKEEQFSANKNERIQELREIYIEKLQMQSTNRNTLMHLEKEKERLQQRHLFLEKALFDSAQQLKQTETKRKEQQKVLETEQASLEKKEAEVQKRTAELSQAEKNGNELMTKLQELSKTLQQAEARKESQQELEDNYASYYQGVKEILKRRETLSGIRGAVGELFQVPDPFTLAIETALGGAVQHIVVENPSSASRCIAILKEKRLGRATFLPLSVIQEKNLPSSVQELLKNTDGYVGVAADLISYGEDYQRIARNLLGTTIVSRDLNSGLALAAKANNRWRIVSLEGDVIHPGGSMSGGTAKNSQAGSLFNRKNSIAQLAALLKEKKAAYQTVSKKLQEAQNDYRMKKEALEKLQKERDESRFYIEKLHGLEEQEKEKEAVLKEEAVSLQYEKQTAAGDSAAAEADSQKEKELQLALSAEIEEIKKEMEYFSLNEEERVTRLQEIQTEMQNSREVLAVLVEQEKQLQSAFRQSQTLIETESLNVEQMEEKLVNAKEQETSESSATSQINQAIADAKNRKMEAEKKLKEKREAKQEWEQQLKEKDALIQTAAQALKRCWAARAKSESSSSRFETEIDHRLNRLSEEYALSFEAAKAGYALSLSTEKASAEVRRLKEEIHHLGPINLGAIEEFEKISERFEFLSLQQQDLLTARETLVGTMKEMDKEVAERFEKKFFQIQAQFEKTFPKLFGGGKATIELTDPENLLETGIEIAAQPPGKKLQQLSLLSGGEKAFTAIALLFSIIEVSPVPFCILDEVEAALDETNVSRFGKYLASFENKTQFIVITHRKGTMEEADVLYGVTMQDSGVSRLASVRLGQQAEVI